MAASTSIQQGSPFKVPCRMPLAELPLRNFIERPPSPLKSYSSPSKVQTLTTFASHSPSPARAASSSHVDVPSRHQLFRETFRNGDVTDTPLENSIPIEEKKSTKKSPAFASPKAVMKAASLQTLSYTKSSSSSSSPLQSLPNGLSPPSKKISSSAPQSLAKKKDRIRRELLDEDEGGAANIRAGSPSPSKDKTQRQDSLRGIGSSSSTSTNSDVGSRSRMKQTKHDKKKEAWTVWQDNEPTEEGQTNPQPSVESTLKDDDETEDQDKENARLRSNVVVTSRKKGTGGRLSLLATADDAESEHSFNSHEKRRKVTPSDNAP